MPDRVGYLKCRYQRLFGALKRVAISLRTEYANDDGVNTILKR